MRLGPVKLLLRHLVTPSNKTNLSVGRKAANAPFPHRQAAEPPIHHVVSSGVGGQKLVHCRSRTPVIEGKEAGGVTHTAQQFDANKLPRAAKEARPIPIRSICRYKLRFALCLDLVFPHHDIGAFEGCGKRHFSSRHIALETCVGDREALAPPATDKVRASDRGQNLPERGKPRRWLHPAVLAPADPQNSAPAVCSAVPFLSIRRHWR